ncbi:MAG TPA: type VI secretion system tube protein TssD [Hymenobacter sp.]|jgi:hypothetical protein|uniref:type VI secretion system tube protein TssD n=1 Tax=Hymenobacter sp. TaxID=1898978 RepID=UPI002ED9322A
MASFYAELEVAGHSYPVRLCEFFFTQATNERGRVAAKVRHSLLHLTVDVPAGDQLLAWGAAPHKPLAGHVTFFETNRLVARETVGFAAGHCVGYEETFVAGDDGEGAYVCRLTVAAEKLELTPGGPARALVAAETRDYAAPLASGPTVSPVSSRAITSDCTDSMRQSLQNQVKQNCKSGKQACSITDNCPVLEETMATLNACIAARTKINMVCFKGGDAGHKEQIIHKINGLVKCQGYYFNKCKPSQPVPAPRRAPSSEPVRLPPIPKEAPLTVAGVGLFILYLLSGALRPGPI